MAKPCCTEGRQAFWIMYRLDIGTLNSLLEDWERLRTYITTEDVVNHDKRRRYGWQIMWISCFCGSKTCPDASVPGRWTTMGYVIKLCHLCRGIYCSIWKLVDSINMLSPAGLYLTDIVNLTLLQEVFARELSQFCLHGLISALDGWVTWTNSPGSQLPNPNRYDYAWMENFGLLLMVIEEPDRKFIWFDLSCTFTTHDSLAWSTTNIGHCITEDKLPEPFCILEDRSFTCTRCITISRTNNNLNFEQSSLRIKVKRAFGVVVRR